MEKTRKKNSRGRGSGNTDKANLEKLQVKGQLYLTTRELCAYCQTSVSNQCANRSKKLREQKEIQISAAYEYVEAAGTGLSRGLNPTPCWLTSWIESRRVFCSTRHASICRHRALCSGTPPTEPLDLLVGLPQSGTSVRLPASSSWQTYDMSYGREAARSGRACCRLSSTYEGWGGEGLNFTRP